jgi:polyferredoxin
MADNSMIIGAIFLLSAMAAVALLAHIGRLGGKVHISIMVIAVALGFIFFAPVLPFQMMGIIVDGPQTPQILAAVLITAVLVTAALAGRLYCGGACPIGALQELAYLLPGPKAVYADRRKLFAIRGIILIAMIIAALEWHTNPLAALGVKSAFSLQMTLGTLLLTMIIAVGVFWYRPFCRVLCPYGAIMTMFSSKLALGLRRSRKCVSCKSCEKACPTGEAYGNSAGRDCYMCGRCTRRCKFDAIGYTIKEEKK